MGSIFAQPSAALVETIAPSLVTLVIKPWLQGQMKRDTFMFDFLWCTELENNVRALVTSPLKTALHHLRDARDHMKRNQPVSTVEKSLDWAYQYAVEALSVHEQLANHWDRFHVKVNILIIYVFVKWCRNQTQEISAELATKYRELQKEFAVYMGCPTMHTDVIWYKRAVAEYERAIQDLVKKHQAAIDKATRLRKRLSQNINDAQAMGFWTALKQDWKADSKAHTLELDLDRKRKDLHAFQNMRFCVHVRGWMEQMSKRDQEVAEMQQFFGLSCVRHDLAAMSRGSRASSIDHFLERHHPV